MALRSETLQVGGVRCEQCVMRLGAALQPLDGIASANANLLGQVMVTWDEERLRREEIVAAIARAGFEPDGSEEYPGSGGRFGR